MCAAGCFFFVLLSSQSDLFHSSNPWYADRLISLYVKTHLSYHRVVLYLMMQSRSIFFLLLTYPKKKRSIFFFLHSWDSRTYEFSTCRKISYLPGKNVQILQNNCRQCSLPKKFSRSFYNFSLWTSPESLPELKLGGKVYSNGRWRRRWWSVGKKMFDQLRLKYWLFNKKIKIMVTTQTDMVIYENLKSVCYLPKYVLYILPTTHI